MQTNKKILINKEDIIPTAQRMRDEGRMLLLIHGHRDTEGQPVICYDYFVGDVFESYEVRKPSPTSLPSMTWQPLGPSGRSTSSSASPSRAWTAPNVSSCLKTWQKK